jgi:hypothetical protein
MEQREDGDREVNKRGSSIMRGTTTRLTGRAALLVLTAALVLLAFSQAAPAATTAFTVKEVDKAGNEIQIGTWPYDAASQTFTGAPFVSTLSMTDVYGTTLGYLPLSGQDAFTANTKFAVVKKGIYLDDLAAWVAAQNDVPLGADTALNVVSTDSDPEFYWNLTNCVTSGGSQYPMTLGWVDDASGAGRYWYPSYNFSSTPSTATFDTATRVPVSKALLGIVSASVRRDGWDNSGNVLPGLPKKNPTTYADVIQDLNVVAANATDDGSLCFFMGQRTGNYTELNLGMVQAKWIQSLTFTPAYLDILTSVTGGAATVTTDDGYLEATAGEPVSFTVTGVESGKVVDAVTVTDADGESVTVTDAGGTYSFPMPALSATIAVSLREGTTASLQLRAGWNLVAGGPGTTFPATLFAWSGSSFASTTSPVAWQGYWCKSATAQTVTMNAVRGPHTITLAGGWDLIGNPMAASAALTMPTGKVAFAYDASAHAYTSTTTLAPGQGAWVKGSAGETVSLTAQ